jgi:alpha/beta superfamily hydrolase
MADILREIPGPLGPLEALLDMPPSGTPRAVCVFGHPLPTEGGTMHTKAVYQAAKAMARIGVAALRFNFRGVGRSVGSFDAGRGEKADFRAAMDFAEQRLPGVHIWAAGMSFGSWVAMAAGAEDPRVHLLFGIAPPIDRYDFSLVSASPKPKFIVHGEADELISIKDVRKFYSQMVEPKELVVIEDADHLFDGKTSLVGEAVEDLLVDWDPAPDRMGTGN